MLKLVFVLCLILVSCKTQSFSEPKSIISEASAILWKQNRIKVCWEPIRGTYPQKTIKKIQSYQTLGNEILHQEYNLRTNIEFEGFNTCNEENENIRIRLDYPPAQSSDRLGEFGTRVKFIGSEIDGVRDGVFIRLDRNDESHWDFYVRNFKIELLHEIGHALGLLHEHIHPNNACDRDSRETFNPEFHRVISTYDGDSIMDYCQVDNLRRSQIPVHLSVGDVSGINSLFGRSTNEEKADSNKLATLCKDEGGKWLVSCCLHPTKFIQNSLFNQCGFSTKKESIEFCAANSGSWLESLTCCENLTIPSHLTDSEISGLDCNNLPSYSTIKACDKDGGRWTWSSDGLYKCCALPAGHEKTGIYAVCAN